MRVYLDNCCFNRPYDDQTFLTIRLETEAKLAIQEKIKAGQISLGWSYILDAIDKGILKKSADIREIEVMNPISFISKL